MAAQLQFPVVQRRFHLPLYHRFWHMTPVVGILGVGAGDRSKYQIKFDADLRILCKRDRKRRCQAGGGVCVTLNVTAITAGKTKPFCRILSKGNTGCCRCDNIYNESSANDEIYSRRLFACAR
ncbi:hypothetical protein MJ590_12915 [Escherichia coli]|nr:hypothetical protein MJ590_12915 [Escherichia coli]